jgi:hypothetical protein
LPHELENFYRRLLGGPEKGRAPTDKRMMARPRPARQAEVPSNLEEWLNKWEPRISTFKKRKRKEVSSKATNALDELEFLLARTVENQVSE